MEEYIIYGAGRYGRMAFDDYKDNMKILFFVDADRERWGTTYCGLEIKPPFAIARHENATLLVAIRWLNSQILEELEKIGARNIKVYHPSLGIRAVEQKTTARSKPGILVECSLYVKTGRPTGAERLMYSVLMEMGAFGKKIKPVIAIDHDIVTSGTCEEQCRIYIGSQKKESFTKINIMRGDKILFLSGSIFGSFHNIIDEVKEKIDSYVVIWDLIYIHHKGLDTDNYKRKSNIAILNKSLEIAKGVICYSKTVANEVHEYYKEACISRLEPLCIYLFPLGSNLTESKEKSNVRGCIKDFMSDGQLFLMVGNIMEHKNHHLAIEAFKRMSSGVNIKLLIVGQVHSDIKSSIMLAEEICSAVKDMSNVFWIRDASDDEVSYCYEHAAALIQASAYEGYGLPLIEAARYGLPLICSDIPIFREVTCGYADFFRVGDVDSLAETLKKWLNEDKHPDSRNIPVYTWKESAEALLDIVDGNAEPYVKVY